tara:strand:- start:412 stop:582 length:171 start_codon:yes stop_codon:yes gene_type:complete
LEPAEQENLIQVGATLEVYQHLILKVQLVVEVVTLVIMPEKPVDQVQAVLEVRLQE